MTLSKAIRGTIIVLILTLLASAASYFFRIVLARSLSIEEYGLFYAMLAFFGMVSFIFDLGIGQAVAKNVIDLNIKKKFGESKGLLLSTLFFQLAIASVLFFILLYFSQYFTEHYFKISTSIFFIFMCVWFLTLPLTWFLSMLFIGTNRVELASSQELFRQVVALIISGVGIYIGYGINSPFIAYSSINLLMILIYFPFINRSFPGFFSIKAKYNFTLFLETLKFGSYLAFTGLLYFVITQTDTILLTTFLGTKAVGIYQIAVPIALILTYFSGALTTVAFPIISALHSTKKLSLLSQGTYIIYKYALIVTMPLAIMIFAFSKQIIILLFDVKYIDATLTLQILVIGTLFSLLTTINNTILTASGFPKEIAKNMFFVALLNLGLNLILIPHYGTAGAAFSSMMSFLFAFIISQKKLKKYVSVSVPWKEFIYVFAIGIVSALLILVIKNYMQFSFFIQAGVIGFVFILIYISLLFLMNVVDVDEIKELVRLTLKDK